MNIPPIPGSPESLARGVEARMWIAAVEGFCEKLGRPDIKCTKCDERGAEWTSSGAFAFEDTQAVMKSAFAQAFPVRPEWLPTEPVKRIDYG